MLEELLRSNRKSQSFGFDVLLTVTAVLIFSQLLPKIINDNSEVLLSERRIENGRTLYLALVYNNSLALFDNYACDDNIESLYEAMNNTKHFLDTYVNNREYLLSMNDEVLGSEGVENVCLKNSASSTFRVESSCKTVLTFQFSIYTKGEKGEC
ncbi:Uncharacterised protein [Candidatus Tiddalikarchaeum anstoanum]|nr:Uncharacterised protein [Candidatus Tiddalikarchaeum anstoanum]